MFTMMYLNYVILPGLNIFLFVYYTANPKYNLKIFPLESWIVFFSILCITRISEFFVSLKKIIMDDARIYIVQKENEEKGDFEHV